MAAKKIPPRAARRLQARVDAKLVRDRERLARLEPGGTPNNPIDVLSASQVEVHARSMTCLRCNDEMLVDEHAAETIDGAHLRIARMRCPSCGARREIFFRITGTALN